MAFMDSNITFKDYKNSYYKFTGQMVDDDNTESLSLLFQYIQTKNMLLLRDELFELKVEIFELTKAVKQLG